MKQVIILSKVEDLNYTDPSKDLGQTISDYLARKLGGAVDFTFIDNGERVRVVITGD